MTAFFPTEAMHAVYHLAFSQAITMTKRAAIVLAITFQFTK